MAVKGQGPRRSSSPSNVPNFCRLAPCPSSSAVTSRLAATDLNEGQKVLNAAAVASTDGKNGFGGRLTGGDVIPSRLLSVAAAHPAAAQGMVLVPSALLGLNMDNTGPAARLAATSGVQERLDLQSLLERRQQQSDARSAMRRDELLSLLRDQQQRANGPSRDIGISATAAQTPDSSVLLRQLHEARYLVQTRQHAHCNELMRLLVAQSHETSASTTLASPPAATGHSGRVWTNSMPLSAAQQQQLEQLHLLELLNRPLNP
jgi:hypothetical protein